MNLLDMIKNLTSQFGASPSHFDTVKDAYGTTYGPAQTRITHTPVNFTANQSTMSNPNDVGEYYPGHDRIQINPTIDDPSETTRHESIHALFNRMSPQEESSIATSAPNFDSIAHAIFRKANAPNAAQEVPAYMGMSPQSKYVGITDDQHAKYLQAIRDSLMQLHPEIGATFQKLMDSGKRPVPNGPSENFNNYTGQ